MKIESLEYLLKTLEYGLLNCSDDNNDNTTHFNRFQNSIDLVKKNYRLEFAKRQALKK